MKKIKKKDVHDQGPGGSHTSEEPIVTGYVQNAEQNENTLFKRILKATNREDFFKPIDRLYIEYNKDQFRNIKVGQQEEPELYQFINDIKNGTHKFHDYPQEDIDYYASRIYELRKNYDNNSTG